MKNEHISVFIVDDEELARERLKRLITHYANYHVVGDASDGYEAVDKITQLKPDIVLLDIRMPGRDGLEVAEYVSQLDYPPAIIFCTAYDDYAIQAFKHQALDYLLKPVHGDQLFSALNSANRVNKLQLRAIQNIEQDVDQSFVAHSWQGRVIIPFASIYFFRSEQKYITVVHSDGETISDQTLKELEQKYPEQLIRAHRNSLVNIKYVSAMSKDGQGHYFLQIKGTSHQIPVSRRHVTEIKQKLEKLG